MNRRLQLIILSIAGFFASCTSRFPPTGEVQESQLQAGLLTYSGGPVIQDVKVVHVKWNGGNGSYDTFYSDLVGSAYLSWLGSVYATNIPANDGYSNEPGTNQRPGIGTFLGTFSVWDSTFANPPEDATIENTLSNAFTSLQLPLPDERTVYMIHVPDGVEVYDGGFGGGPVCGYHFYGRWNPTGDGHTFVNYYYALVGNGSFASGGRGSCNSYTVVASHELAEAITNPYINARAWYAFGQGEIADLCQGQGACQGQYAGAITINGHPYCVNELYNNLTGDCVVSLPSVASYAGMPGVTALGGDFGGGPNNQADGKSDILLLGLPGKVVVGFSNGDGTFRVVESSDTAAVNMAGWARTAGAKFVVGDYDHDGKADVVITGVSGWTTLPMGLSNGDGTFRTSNSNRSCNAIVAGWASAAGAKLVPGDFNHDHVGDFAIIGVPGWSSIPVAWSNGDGATFNCWNVGPPTAPNNGTVTSWASTAGAKIVPGFFNHDTNADFVITGIAGWTSVPMATSNGNGSFGAYNLAPPTAPNNGTVAGWAATNGAKLIPGDFNHDGWGDFVITGVPGWSGIPIAISNGDGSFGALNLLNTTLANWAATPGAQFVSGDFDGDSYDDFAITGVPSWPTIPVAFSNGNGTFRITNY